MKRFFGWVLAIVTAAAIAVGAVLWLSWEQATVPVEAGYGPDPALPEPNPTLIPTLNFATPSPWPEGETPVAAAGLAVKEFAGGLDHPRTLHVLPNGDVLVAETSRPERDLGGIRAFAERYVMGLVGAGVESANRITLLRDADGDGVAEFRSTFAEGLNSPFGMALVGDRFYVANTDAVVAFGYAEGATAATGPAEKIVDLPAGPINHHWTKDLIASWDGTKLYATAGSNSNVGENGMEAEENRAAVLEIDLATRQMRLFASGLRNPNGLAWNPENGALWVAVNERDEIGSDLVPDYMTSVRDGGFYGWPYSYFGQHADVRVEPQRPDLVAQAIVPDYALGAHTASLGLTFSTEGLGAGFGNGAYVGQHGSWNRRPRSGYKVVFVPFTAGQPAGEPRDVLTGFISADDRALGRPVGVAFSADGALLVADDTGNKVWRVYETGE